MPKIKFAKTHNPIEANTTDSLLSQMREAGIPVASSCGGMGICGKCRVKVIMGAQNISAMTDEERECLKNNNGNPDGERLSCQSELSGDVLVDTDYW